MNRALTISLIAAAAFGMAACENAEPAAYGTTGGPLVAPTNPAAAESSGSTLSKQQGSGYYSTAGCPDVAATTNPGDASTTAAKQAQSGYFPSAGCPVVAPSTTAH